MTRLTHRVKSWSMFFTDILKGIRTADIRWTGDRRYAVGDLMELYEWDPVTNLATGRELTVEITYIQQNKSNPCAISQFALNDGYAVLSIKPSGELKINRQSREQYQSKLGVSDSTLLLDILDSPNGLSTQINAVI